MKVRVIKAVHWHVDASFAVHPDFKSHTGANQVFSGSEGSVQVASAKQGLNTNSSTASELVGSDQVLPSMSWTPSFVEAQGHKIKKNRVFQDNKPTVSSEENGKQSSGKRTRALNIRHFMITDQAKRGNAVIEHCPTDEMLADHVTKGSQGVKFSKFGRRVVGMDPEPFKKVEKLQDFGLIKQ